MTQTNLMWLLDDRSQKVVVSNLTMVSLVPSIRILMTQMKATETMNQELRSYVLPLAFHTVRLRQNKFLEL